MPIAIAGRQATVAFIHQHDPGWIGQLPEMLLPLSRAGLIPQHNGHDGKPLAQLINGGHHLGHRHHLLVLQHPVNPHDRQATLLQAWIKTKNHGLGNL